MSLKCANYITGMIDFIKHLKNDANINNITDENLLILFQLSTQIQNGFHFNEFNEIDLIKRLNLIKKLNEEQGNQAVIKYEIKEEIKSKLNVTKKESVIIVEDKKTNNKQKKDLKKFANDQPMINSLDEHVDLSKIIIKNPKPLTFSKVLQKGISNQENKNDDSDNNNFTSKKESNETNETNEKNETNESVKSSKEKEINEKSKINFKNKDEFSKIINDYKDHIIKVGEEAIKNNVDKDGNEIQFREITSEVMRFGNELYEEYKGTFPNGYVAFSQIQYGPLNPKKDGVEPNYNERNLSIYEKYDEELGFKKAQKYFLDKGYKLLDISDPFYKTREYNRNKSYENKSNITSTRIKIILVNKSYTIKQENIKLWHGLNKLSEVKDPIQIIEKKSNKVSRKFSSKEENIDSEQNVSNEDNEDSVKTEILSAEDAFEEKIIEESKNGAILNESFPLIDN
jgi:hypothetical protein